jgi:hypothetical protein
MAQITGLIDAILLELRWIRSAMRIVTIAADDLSFSHGHMRRTHQLCFSLQVALPAYLNFRSSGKERGDLGKFRQLLAAGLFHDGVTVNTRKAATLVRTGVPVGLNAALMTV